AWEDELNKAGVEVYRVDLQSEGWKNLGLSSVEELQASLTGSDPTKSVSEGVLRLQRLVEECQFLVFVHPIFWFDVPSQLKGFQESVLSSGFAFRKLPGHWLLNRAVGVAERLPVVRGMLRRYASYGLLRDKRVYVTRTQGGPSAGMGIYGHEATSLESSVQFCGAHLSAVDVLAELDDLSEHDLSNRVLPNAKKRIQEHCRRIAATAVPSTSILSSALPDASAEVVPVFQGSAPPVEDVIVTPGRDPASNAGSLGSLGSLKSISPQRVIKSDSEWICETDLPVRHVSHCDNCDKPVIRNPDSSRGHKPDTRTPERAA
ncbi:unnamed protein product, partial [Polarella glacialis]